MTKNKGKAQKSSSKQDRVWLSPRYSLNTRTKAPLLESNTPPPANRLLELADTSLDLWQIKPKRFKIQKAG